MLMLEVGKVAPLVAAIAADGGPAAAEHELRVRVTQRRDREWQPRSIRQRPRGANETASLTGLQGRPIGSNRRRTTTTRSE